MGMINYLRELIPNLAEIADLLRNSLRKYVLQNWSSNQDKVFSHIKQIIFEVISVTVTKVGDIMALEDIE